ncbi:MAG: outer membrane beta-barrel protein [Bacteroidaceae bacterium]|nr:outer membrane beta-barrel protein [Bacteroidaceae bacterium]
MRWIPRDDLHTVSQSATFDADPDSLGSTVALLDTLLRGSAHSPLRRLALNSLWEDRRERYRYLQLDQRVHLSKHLGWGHDFFAYAEAKFCTFCHTDQRQQHYDYYRQQQPNDHRLVLNPEDNRNLQLEVHAEYIVNLPKGWHALAYYNFRRTDEKSDKPYWTLDPLAAQEGGGGAGVLSAVNSIFTHYYNDKHCLGPRFYFHKQDARRYLWFNVHLPMNWHNERESYLRAPVDTCVRQRVFTFTPDMTFICQDHERHTYWLLNASRAVQTPDIVGKVGYRDAVNPLAVTIGNPHLKSAYTYHWKAQFQHSRPHHEQVLSLGLGGQATHNAITQATVYNPTTGSYTTQQQNISGHWKTELSTTFQRTLDTLRHWRVEQSLTLSYRHAPQYAATAEHTVAGLLQTQKHAVSTFALTEQFSLRYRLNDRFDVCPSLSLVYNHSDSDLPTFRLRNIYNLSYGLTLHWTLPLRIQLGTDLNLYTTRGYDDQQMNRDCLVWNAQLTRSFFRGRLVARLTAFDLLSQLSDLHHSHTDTGTISYWTLTLQRYVLLSLQWQLGKSP